MSTGLNSSNINTIKNNQAPNAELLAILRVQENVNVNWVLDGSGSPYGAYRAASDEEAAERLKSLLADESGWTTHLFISHEQKVIVLTQPGRMLVKEKWIDYTNVEIISGNIENKAIEVAVAQGAYQVEMIQADLQRLSTGWMGNKEILDWIGKPERLIKAEPLDTTLKVADPATEYQTQTAKSQLHTLVDSLSDTQAQTLAELITNRR